MLKIENVSKYYGKKIALSDINLELHQGLYALLGQNGAGKSTLMNLVCDCLLPTTGEISWEGKSIQN